VVHQTLTCAVALGGLLSGREHGQPDGHPQTASWDIGRREGAPVQLHHARRKWIDTMLARLWNQRASIVSIREDLIYQRAVAALRAQGVAQTGVDWVGVTVTWKAVLLEGLEVVFVVLTLGARDAAAFHAALWGALAAGVLVLLVGLLLHQPLTRVPEHGLKLSVGVLLCSFGVFWGAEGLGAVWPWDALTLVGILTVLLTVSWGSVRLLRRMLPQGAQLAARNV
jgi:uncharacterized membrane protein